MSAPTSPARWRPLSNGYPPSPPAESDSVMTEILISCRGEIGGRAAAVLFLVVCCRVTLIAPAYEVLMKERRA